jgi:hypothetical protein
MYMRKIFVALAAFGAIAGCSSTPPARRTPVVSTMNSEDKKSTSETNNLPVVTVDGTEFKKALDEGWENISNGTVAQSDLSINQQQYVLTAMTAFVFGAERCAPPYKILQVKKLNAISGNTNEIWVINACRQMRWNVFSDNGQVQIRMLGN